MKREGLSKQYTIQREKMETDELLKRVATEIGKNGYRIMRTTRKRLLRDIMQARRKRNLKTRREIVIGTVALVAAAAYASSGHKVIVQDINAGRQIFGFCAPPLHPPCMIGTVIGREDTLRSELPHFATIVNTILQND